MQREKVKLRQAHNKLLETMDFLMDSFDVAKDEAVLREYGNQFYIEDDDFYQEILSSIEIIDLDA